MLDDAPPHRFLTSSDPVSETRRAVQLGRLFHSGMMLRPLGHWPQQRLYFLPDPHGQGLFRDIFSDDGCVGSRSCST